MSRRTREEEHRKAATRTVGPQGSPRRRRLLWILVATVAIALGATAPLWWKSRSRPGPRLASAVEVPNPDTTGYEAPVREVVAQSRKAVLDHPTTMTAWGTFATVLDANLFLAEAEIAYRRALELAPGDPALSYDLAILRETRGGDPEESLSLYRRFAQLEPTFPPVHVRIGRILAVQGRMEEAAESYRTALRLDPKLTIARRALGQVLIVLDDAPGAASELQRVAAEVPEDGPTQAALAQVYTRLGDEKRAEEAARRGRNLTDKLSLPDPVQFLVTKQARSARMSLARAEDRLKTSDYAGAVGDLNIVLRTRAKDPTVHERIADAYKHLGNEAQAGQHMQEARRLRGEQ